ncbi:flagellin [Desulfatirhabdium butyrativorans]|uniref:flagellin N-terminal helical domain-containing protein n=1 Tax=Desulfatirhabdium butyrativorans TaxID=340467 RepID=UPI000412A12A|nr:flagellin [Desulfatirhabdium butyrativorans]
MALTIRTNLPAEVAQKNLSRSQNALNRSLERLSSGLRINSAKDDAAGMAVSNRFSAQIRGLNQAVRNANDGISMLQTSEGGMQEVTNLLQRMRELAVQASNDTYSQADRASMQAELDQLYSEIDRIATSTQFNGVGLLDGSGGAKSFQIGSDAGQSISVKLQSVRTKDLHLNGYSALGELNSGRLGSSLSASGLTINGVAIDGSTATADTAYTAATNINAKTGQTGVTATAYNTLRGSGGVSGIVNGLKINGMDVAPSGSMEELVANINRDVGGVTAVLNSDGSITLSNDTGKDILIGGTVTNSGLTANRYRGYLSLSDAQKNPIAVTATTDDSNGVKALHQWGFNISNGLDALTGGTVSSNLLSAGDLYINGVDVGATKSASAADKAAAINSVTDKTGVKASAITYQELTVDMTKIASMTASSLTINGSQIDLSSATSLEDVISAITDTVNGINASATEDGKLVLQSASGYTISVYDQLGFTGVTPGDTTAYLGKITLSSETGTDIVISGSAADPTTAAKAGFVEQGGSSEAIGSGLSLMSLANANNAIKRIDEAIDRVSYNRAQLGAVQNRLESTINNLQNVAENFMSANGRITDADFAKETAEMTKNQILSQAGVAMLSQAKQIPQQAIQLLQQ